MGVQLRKGPNGVLLDHFNPPYDRTDGFLIDGRHSLTVALALLELYLGNDTPEPDQGTAKPRFEDMVAKAQQSVVLILVY